MRLFQRTLLTSLPLILLAFASQVSAATQRCNGEAQLCDRTFDQVVLAATHNSMSASSLGWTNPNQQVAIHQQLTTGIRGLLIDTHYAHVEPNGTVANDLPVSDFEDASGRQIFLCHIFCNNGATPLLESLTSIRNYLRKNPNNVLLIINEDNVHPTDFAAVVKSSGLEDYVYKGAVGKKWPTLKKMIATKQQVVMLAEKNATGVPWYHLAYGGVVQETPYTWKEPALLTEKKNWPASCIPNRGDTKGALFLMNHWSPPAGPSPAGSAIVNAKKVIVGRGEACQKLRRKMPTVVAVDMFRSGNLLSAVHELNSVD